MPGTALLQPRAAVIAVTWREGSVILVRRSTRPNAGHWGFPGGKVHYGEPVLDAAERELLEETRVRGRARQAFDAADVIGAGTPASYHYLLVAVLVDWVEGEPAARDDVEEAAWFRVTALPTPCSDDVERIARQAGIVRQRLDAS